jgi:hypothetical protein
MSVYSRKGKWTYDFVHRGKRYYALYPCETKSEAKEKMQERKKALRETGRNLVEQIPKDMGFRELVSHRLDYLELHRTRKHYADVLGQAKRWVTEWKQLDCSEITQPMIQGFLDRRKRQVSAFAANKDLRQLRRIGI